MATPSCLTDLIGREGAALLSDWALLGNSDATSPFIGPLSDLLILPQRRRASCIMIERQRNILKAVQRAMERPGAKCELVASALPNQHWLAVLISTPTGTSPVYPEYGEAASGTQELDTRQSLQDTSERLGSQGLAPHWGPWWW